MSEHESEIKRFLELLTSLHQGRPSMEALVLRYGRSFAFDRSTFAGRRMRLHACYSNAGRMALADESLTYCEGYVLAVIPIQHAWLIDSAGHVIDPTLRVTRRGASSIERVGEYFGVPFSTSYLRRVLLAKRTWGVLGWDNRSILSEPPASWLAAHANLTLA